MGGLIATRLGERVFTGWQRAAKSVSKRPLSTSTIRDPWLGGGGFELLLIGNGADRGLLAPHYPRPDLGVRSPARGLRPRGLRFRRLRKARSMSKYQQLTRWRFVSFRQAGRWSARRRTIRIFSRRSLHWKTGFRQTKEIAPADAILARIPMIHHYRRVLLRDPLLPQAAFAKRTGRQARHRDLCAQIYRGLLRDV